VEEAEEAVDAAGALAASTVAVVGGAASDIDLVAHGPNPPNHVPGIEGTSAAAV
jgi:hypothetical protein